MWKYNHTDEMYTGKYDRSEKLYHSDVYLGQDYTDGIYHFKYIKREKKNGKWVYYYKDDLTDQRKKDLLKAETKLLVAKGKSKIANTKRNIAEKIYDKGPEFLKKPKTTHDKKTNTTTISHPFKNKLDSLKSDALIKSNHVKSFSTDVKNAKYQLSESKKKDEKRKKAAKKVIKFLNKLSNAGYKVKKTLDTKALEALSKGHIKYGKTVKKNKTGGEDTKVVKRSNKLLSEGRSSSTTFTGSYNWSGGSGTMKPTTYNDREESYGKIAQAYDDTKKKLYKKYKKKYEKTYGKSK